MAKTYKSPGVYIEERSAFPNSVVPVPTAVPAFIGYTEKAVRADKPLTLQPTRISSFGEYLLLFGGGPQTKFTISSSPDPAVPYTLKIKEGYFTLHSQMKMFFSNGGTDCYVVSVGGYTREDGTPNVVDAAVLKTGIAPLKKEMEPTILVIPELTSVKITADADGVPVENEVKALYTVYNDVLLHCGVEMRNRFAILDVWMDRANYQSDTYSMERDFNLFRESVTAPALDWGATYYPYLKTTAVPLSDISVLNVANHGEAGDVQDYPAGTFDEATGMITDPEGFRTTFVDPEVTSLLSLLDTSLNRRMLNEEVTQQQAEAIKTLLKEQVATVTAVTATTVTQSLRAISPVFNLLVKDIQAELNLLPPSAAMAGIYSMVDNSVGVQQSPANVGVGSVIQPAVNISNEQQEGMNVPIGGKAVNAIRSFPGKGVLVWGARTLDGNSQDWRYISVRRTVIFIEQSVKYAAESYVFEPNTSSTWTNIKAVLSNFLTNVWQSGALAGASAQDAFSVDVGLGSTMTPVDILDGIMRISIKVAVTRPAEFIVITFEQQMQQS